MLGKRGTGAILATVDRKSHHTLLARLRTTLPAEVNLATVAAARRSKQVFRSITNDNGHEFGEFWDLERELEAPIYFTHPLCPWERGTVENTIGLLRQFIPKKSDLTQVTEQDLNELEVVINSRPRKSLNYRTPYEYVTGKIQKLIKQRKIEEPSEEEYARSYLSPEELEEREISSKTCRTD